MILIANVNGGSVRAEYLDSLLSLFADERTQALGLRYRRRTGLYVERLRESLAMKMLADDPDCEWMLTVDSDMVFGPDDLLALVASADPDERPVVGGVYYSDLGAFGIGPVAWSSWPTTLLDDSGEGLAPVEAIGTGFLLIHRSVLERVLAANGRIFTPGRRHEEENEGEDIIFCRRARELGVRLHANLDVRLGHEKTVTLVAARDGVVVQAATAV